ncbi:MAG: glycosyltransferase family A protein [Balneolaceae bacterium]
MQIKASVIIRSYNRVEALCELLEILLLQDFDSFEIVIVEQSTEYKKESWNKLLLLSSSPKVKLLTYEPLGGPRARNEGVKNASGEILIFIDDDDLPTSTNWISKHIEAYQNPKLVGFTGRHIFEGNSNCPYVPWLRWYIRRKVMSYSFLKLPYTFAQFDEDVPNVGWLHGTNSSIRKDWALKAGLWDTHVKNQDEHSFAFKLQPFLTDGFHLEFKKEPAVIRRMNIGGGMGKRKFSIRREFQNQYRYFKHTVFRYFPELKKYYPFILILISGKVVMKFPRTLF